MDGRSLNNMTREWIMIMLYNGPKSIDQLINRGCKTMVFGHSSYEDFQKIVETLQNTGFIDLDVSKKPHVYSLTTKSIFNIKKNTIIPLLALAENPDFYDAFVVASREKCDLEIIEMISRQPNIRKKEAYIVDYSEQKLKHVTKLLDHFFDYLKRFPEKDPTNPDVSFNLF